MQIFAEVFDAFICEEVVVVLPRELGLDISSGVERLKGFDDLQVGNIDGLMLGLVEILLGNKHSFLKEISVYRLSVLL